MSYSYGNVKTEIRFSTVLASHSLFDSVFATGMTDREGRFVVYHRELDEEQVSWWLLP
jgi:hypothetical protein